MANPTDPPAGPFRAELDDGQIIEAGESAIRDLTGRFFQRFSSRACGPWRTAPAALSPIINKTTSPPDRDRASPRRALARADVASAQVQP